MGVLEINPIQIKLGTNMNNFRSLQMFLMALRSRDRKSLTIENLVG